MKKLHFLPGFIFLGISLFLLTLPGSSVPSGWFFIHIPQFDKIVHIGMFGMLCILFQYRYKKDAPTILPNSNEPAIIITDKAAPANSLDKPNTEKNAALPAIRRADNPT